MLKCNAVTLQGTFMRKLLLCITLFLSAFISACLPTDKRETKTVTQEQMNEILDQALASPKTFQDDLRETCPKFKSMLLNVAETINIGSRIWNAGGVTLTIRLYEGMAYRVLYEAGDECPNLSYAFQAGLARSNQQDDINEKGRVLRDTLDLVMGGPPSKPPGAR